MRITRRWPPTTTMSLDSWRVDAIGRSEKRVRSDSRTAVEEVLEIVTLDDSACVTPTLMNAAS